MFVDPPCGFQVLGRLTSKNFCPDSGVVSDQNFFRAPLCLRLLLLVLLKTVAFCIFTFSVSFTRKNQTTTTWTTRPGLWRFSPCDLFLERAVEKRGTKVLFLAHGQTAHDVFVCFCRGKSGKSIGHLSCTCVYIIRIHTYNYEYTACHPMRPMDQHGGDS